MTKWGDRPHWQFEGIHLGSDEHGEWLGVPAGTRHHRPGHEFHSLVDTVTLVPAGGWYAATFHAPGTWCHLYVDVATPGRWDGDVLRMVDLDLDVVRMASQLPADLPAGFVAYAGPGDVFVDDEDEFAEHQVAFGYPPEVIAGAQASCDELVAAVRAGLPPYDGTHQRWLDALSRLRTS
jgi:predicted RNA-binding protein associated with RNAse of E/G family